MTLEKEMHRRRDAYKDYAERSDRQDEEQRHRRYEDYPPSWPGRLEIHREREGHDGRDYKGNWDSRVDRRDSPRSPYRDPGGSSRIEPGIAGLIFMCNKKTQRRCLAYNVLGMPRTKKRFADHITPGMKLFLFEFESRELHGVFEAVSYVGVDLEPKAFIEADIDFPLQVRFRVVEKCLPLRETEYKDAILENYYENNRFKFDLSKEQVVKLMRLFMPADVPRGSRSFHYPPSAGTNSVDDAYSDFRGPTDSRTYRSGRSDRHQRDDHWKNEPEQQVSKTSYVEGPSRVNYPTYNEYKEPAGRTSYVPHERYYESASAAKFAPSQRSEPDTWCSARPNDYDYGDTLGPGQQCAPSSYAGVSSKCDALGYGIGRPEATTALTTDADRYWKPDSSVLQMSADFRSSFYGRQGSSLYDEMGNGDRVRNMDPMEDGSYRLASKKALVSDMLDYLPPTMTALAPPAMSQVMATGKPATEYREFAPTYSSDVRKASYGYPEDVTRQPSRYSSVGNGLALDNGHALNGVSIPETIPKERYKREHSPVFSDAKYSRHPSERERSFEGRRHFEYQQPAASSYCRNSSETYGRQQKPSVWDRIAAPTKRPKMQNYDKKRREFSPESPQEEDYTTLETERDDGTYVIDFKRRNKGDGLAGTSHNGHRKKKIVRPDSH
ncbi:uncharacterized protein LOC112343462 [Selaginella moellendorffii]|nr:uncharacterized protein LOC112343462 [Selaginella moellendorffii]XP_024522722.1 uncharacterized protein LOC112343462 [Selaginella moellendorffii]|eukprot:XP_024522721.1 uncharacterized protein LOC112343462 [Selaginella moellendorffii]